MQWMYVCPTAMRRITRSLVLLFCAALAVVSLSASSPQPAPLEESGGTVVNVSTEAQLQSALASLASDTTILIAPGTYTLSRTLTIDGALTNVVIRGATSNAADVVLAGRGAGNADFGAVPHGISVGGGVQGITIANLTIRDVYNHAILLAAGTGSPRIQNVRLVDAGQQSIKAAADGAAPVDNGVLEDSVIEATSAARDVHAGGIEIEGGSRWTIRQNVFRNLQAPEGQIANPAVLIGAGGGETVVEDNTFVNCQREIALGAGGGTSSGHTGGIVRNNFIARKAGTAGDAAISIAGSGAQVLHNTILANGSSSVAIDLGSADTTGVVVRNNLTDAEIKSGHDAAGDIADNYTGATPALFVDAAAGDLHLAASATAVMDRVGVMGGAPADWDGEPRPQGGSADYGADEHAAASQQSSTDQAAATQAPAPSLTTAGATEVTTTTLASGATATEPADDASAATASATASSTLPAPWQTADVGNAAPAGTAAYASGTFTVEGGGASIGGSADQFRFVYQTLDGDGDVVARVTDVERTHPWAKAGVMFRDEQTEGARHAFAFVAAGQGAGFEYRQSDGATSTQTSTGTRAIPAFLKVSRRGNTFTAYTSGDGSTWSEMGSQSISMNSLVYVGLAVSSRSTRELATGTFDQVTVTPVDSGTDPDPEPDPTNQPPTVTLTSPANGATFTAPTTVQLAATAADADGAVSQVDFYVNGTLVASDTSSPYTASWNASAAGTFTLTATARDIEGAWTTSAAVSITVAAAAVELPRYVVFVASADHSTKVTSYTVEFFTAGANPSTATPVRTQNLGKPAPVNGEIKVDVAATIQALPSGTYISTVVATGSGGSTRSAPSESFVR